MAEDKGNFAMETADRSSLPPLMELLHVPTDSTVRARISKEIGDGLVLKFEQTLSPPEREIVMRLPPLGGSSPPPDWTELRKFREILERFDDFVLSQMRIFGWRLLLSDRVLGRIAAWSHVEPKGRRWLERLGEELSLFVGIQLGEATFPIDDPGLYEFRKLAIVELRHLLSLTRTHFAQRRPPSNSEVLSWIETKIKEEHESFARLGPELPSLIGFLRDLLQRKGAASVRLRRGEMHAAELFDRWFGARSNRSAEAARQKVSKLGRSVSQ